MPEKLFYNFMRITCVLMVLGVAPAYAIQNVFDHIPTAQKVGQGRMTYLFWDVYDATLYAPDGIWNSEKPFALELSYLRELKGKKIADRSVEEIRNQGFRDEVKLATWHAQMRNIFPNVTDGDTLTGIYTENGEAVFYKDSAEVGRIKDAEFSRAFFNIWLSEKTTEPGLRRKLLGDP